MRKILIAEDNTELNDMMRNYLIKAGHSVYQAFNGAQALEYARSMQPDLVLLDIMMPVIDGYEVCTSLRNEMSIPVIVVSAIVGEDDKVYILELGARSGGSLIPQVTKYATGVDMVNYVIKAAIGEDCSGLHMAPVSGCWSNYMVHSNRTGRFKDISFDRNFKEEHLVDWVSDIVPGTPVHKFRDAQDCIGELIVKYSNPDEMLHVISNMEKYIHIDTE